MTHLSIYKLQRGPVIHPCQWIERGMLPANGWALEAVVVARNNSGYQRVNSDRVCESMKECTPRLLRV